MNLLDHYKYQIEQLQTEVNRWQRIAAGHARQLAAQAEAHKADLKKISEYESRLADYTKEIDRLRSILNAQTACDASKTKTS